MSRFSQNHNHNNNGAEKTKHLILYISEKMQDKDTYGAVVLNKVLYYIDNISYLETGKPISNLSYIRQSNGATPNPKLFLSIRDELISTGKATEKQVPHFGRIQKRLIPLVKPNHDLFSKEEIILMDSIIHLFSDKNATVASGINHTEISWQVAKNKEELPFFTYLLTEATPTDKDIEWAKAMKEKCAHVSNHKR